MHFLWSNGNAHARNRGPSSGKTTLHTKYLYSRVRAYNTQCFFLHRPLHLQIRLLALPVASEHTLASAPNKQANRTSRPNLFESLKGRTPYTSPPFARCEHIYLSSYSRWAVSSLKRPQFHFLLHFSTVPSATLSHKINFYSLFIFSETHSSNFLPGHSQACTGPHAMKSCKVPHTSVLPLHPTMRIPNWPQPTQTFSGQA